LTLASIVHSVAPMVAHGSWRLKERRVGPNLLVGPTGMTTEVHARGEPLPVEFDQGWDFTSDSVRFSKWNERVHVHAPAYSIPMATVRRS
jgi:hypothetical protein